MNVIQNQEVKYRVHPLKIKVYDLNSWFYQTSPYMCVVFPRYIQITKVERADFDTAKQFHQRQQVKPINENKLLNEDLTIKTEIRRKRVCLRPIRSNNLRPNKSRYTSSIDSISGYASNAYVHQEIAQQLSTFVIKFGCYHNNHNQYYVKLRIPYLFMVSEISNQIFCLHIYEFEQLIFILELSIKRKTLMWENDFIDFVSLVQ